MSRDRGPYGKDNLRVAARDAGVWMGRTSHEVGNESVHGEVRCRGPWCEHGHGLYCEALMTSKDEQVLKEATARLKHLVTAEEALPADYNE